jgi:hypothetical protein
VSEKSHDVTVQYLLQMGAKFNVFSGKGCNKIPAASKGINKRHTNLEVN